MHMLMRTLALVQRAFRTDARDIRSHLFRVGLPALFLLTLVLTQLERGMPLAPGLFLFCWLIAYDYIFITFAAATFFATAVAEEREAQTLGLLRMAGVGPLAVLLGKWLPRMWSAVLLLLVQLPFTLLCVTLGGVLWPQIFAAFVCILAHLILVGGIALLCSVMNATSSKACGWATVVIVLLHVGIWFVTSVNTWFVLPLAFMSEFLGSNRLFIVCASGFAEGPISYQVISNLTIGLLLMLTSWVVFDPITTREVSESPNTLSQKLRHLVSDRRRRAWEAAPILWHAFHYVAGGPVWLFLRFGLHLFISFLFMVFVLGFGGSRFDRDIIAGCLMLWGVWATILEGAYLSAQVFRTEISQQTWGTLCMLPENLPSIAYPRLLGAFLGMLPGLGCLSLGCLLFADELLEELFRGSDFFGGVFFFTAVIIWGFHLTTLFSITIDWSAWPIAIFLATVVVVIFFICTVFCANATNGEEELLAVMGIVAWCLTLATHLLIGHKLTLRMAE